MPRMKYSARCAALRMRKWRTLNSCGGSGWPTRRMMISPSQAPLCLAEKRSLEKLRMAPVQRMGGSQ